MIVKEVGLIKIPVSLWSEADKSWFLLTKVTYRDGIRVAASNGFWFPKSICKLIQEEEGHFLYCPEWLLSKNKIEH